MTTNNPALYTFPRHRESQAEPTKVDPESKAPGDHSPMPAMKTFATSITSLLMNLGGDDEAQVPELILLNTDRMQIWFDDTHLIESESRRATVGKYYLSTIGEPTLYKVTDIDEDPDEDYSRILSERAKEKIEQPLDELTLEYCYSLTDRERGPYDGIDESLPRVMFERDGSLPGYMDPPSIPFEKASVSSASSQSENAVGEQSSNLNDFRSSEG